MTKGQQPRAKTPTANASSKRQPSQKSDGSGTFNEKGGGRQTATHVVIPTKPTTPPPPPPAPAPKST